MGQVLIRNVPEETIEAYRQRAKAQGRSLEQELRDLMERHRPFTPAERVEMSRHLRSLSKSPAAPLSLDELREGLE